MKIGYKLARKSVLNVLKDGTYQHETRDNCVDKNKLQTGEVTPKEVISIIEKSCGSDYTSSAHHRASEIEVHIIKKDDWYIKFYFIEEDRSSAMFISVHK